MNVSLAIDLGAGSGRVIAGILESGSLRLEEVHRFDNPGTDLPGGSHWNLVGLFRDIREGLRLAARKYGDAVRSVGIDTWGCDFALLDRDDHLLGLPHQYRDPRHEPMPEVMHRLMPEADIYRRTGITTNFYNSSLHLLAEKQRGSVALEHASTLLFIPDLLSFWLCGRKAVERTIASTSQLLDPATGDWARDVIEALGFPPDIFGDVVAPGTVLGPLRPEIREFTGLGEADVIASASHDTAAAVAGIPMSGADKLWLSSGTWSIIGIETDQAIRGDDAYAARCCNELGIDGSVRLLRNIAGLWIIQECRRQWAHEGEELGYAEMAALADDAPAFRSFIDPDAPVFASPGDMPEKIRRFCRDTGQPVPETKGAILRAATESLALKYRVVYDVFRSLSGSDYPSLHAGGGGIQNDSLNRATADALGLPVTTGPIEATSCGNLIVQMTATGLLPDHAAGRELIRDSFEFREYTPRDPEPWNEALRRFREIL